MPLIIFPLNIIFILFLLCKTFLRISILQMGQVWEVIGYRKMRYFNISTAFHSFGSRILPMRILYSICCVVQMGGMEVAEVIEEEASDGGFLYVKSRLICQLSKIWPSKILRVFLQYIHILVFLFFYPCVKDKRTMWIYMHFACLQLSRGTITSCW